MSRALAATTMVLLLAGCMGSGGGLSEEEASYLDTADAMLTVIGDSMLRFADLSRIAAVGNANWTQQVNDELYLWKAAYSDAPTRLQPPERFADLNADMLAFLALLNAAADDNIAGLEQLDEGRINAGRAKLDQASPLAVDLRSQIRAARES